MRAQFVDYFRRLRMIDPLFDTISWNCGGSYKKMYAEPLIDEMTDADWQRLFDRAQSYDGDILDDNLGIRGEFWNRRKRHKDDGAIKINFRVNALGGGGVGLIEFPERFVDEPTLKAMFAAQIESFDPPFGDVSLWRFTGAPLDPTFDWLFWLRDGEDMPPRNRLRFDHSQLPLPDGEPWLGGTLYTWPEYEPWRFDEVT